MIIFNHISHYWQNLSKTNQKLLKLLIIFSGILLSFYYGKNLIIKHFIGEFLKLLSFLDLMIELYAEDSFIFTLFFALLSDQSEKFSPRSTYYLFSFYGDYKIGSYLIILFPTKLLLNGTNGILLYFLLIFGLGSFLFIKF